MDAHEHGLVYREGEASMTGGAFGATDMTVAGSPSSGCASTTAIASGSDSSLLEISDDEDTLYY